MKTFYSLIKVSPNPSAGDLFTIGIIIGDESEIFVKISESKLKFLHSVLQDSYPLVDFILKEIKLKAAEANKFITESKNLLFENNHLFNSDYFEYLNRYSNNLIQFSKPVKLYDSLTPEKINKMFYLFVDNKVQIEPSIENIQETIFNENIEKKLVSRVKSRVHTNILFDDKIIPSLYFNFHMDCIGLNGNFTGAKSLFFNKNIQTLHTKISDYIALITELEKNYNKELNNKFYLIADEPQRNSKEHQLWEKVKSLKKIKLIISDESDMIADYIEKTDAKTFLLPVTN